MYKLVEVVLLREIFIYFYNHPNYLFRIKCDMYETIDEKSILFNNGVVNIKVVGVTKDFK